MNKKTAITVLVTASLLLNAAGLVVLVCFINLRSSYHKVLQERNTLRQNISAVHAFNSTGEPIGSQQVSKRTFSSLVDGVEDYIAVLAPSVSGRLDNTLVVYLHGMGSNYMEPFVDGANGSIAQALSKRFANLCVLSCNYRKDASWGSDVALADITQNIREVMHQYPIDKIIIMGTSMGGATALTYAATAPEDIKKKICGVVSVEGTGDLSRLSATTASPAVKAALAAAMGGTPETAPAEFQRRSFLSHIEELQKSTRIAVVSANRDTIVPPELQLKVIQELKNRSFAVARIDVEGEHRSPGSEVYAQALEFVLTR